VYLTRNFHVLYRVVHLSGSALSEYKQEVSSTTVANIHACQRLIMQALVNSQVPQILSDVASIP